MQEDEPDTKDKYTKKLEDAERKWGVYEGVNKEWGTTFGKLLEYHNTQDLRTIYRSMVGNKRGTNDELPKKDALDVKELKNWMVPRLEPPIWMYYLWPKRYEKQKTHYDAMKNCLFEGYDGANQNEKPESTSLSKGIYKQNFLKGIIKELREGNKEVYEASSIITSQ